MAWVTPDQEPRVANAVHAESLFGDVGHRIALGLFDKSLRACIAREQKQMTLVEDAPLRIAGLSFAAIEAE